MSKTEDVKGKSQVAPKAETRVDPDEQMRAKAEAEAQSRATLHGEAPAAAQEDPFGREANARKSADVARAPQSAVINGESAPIHDPLHPERDLQRAAHGEHLQGTTEPARPSGSRSAPPHDPVNNQDPAQRTHNEANSNK